jgi:hypothetical protein
MNSSQFLMLNAAITVGLIAYIFFFRSRRPRANPMNMHRGDLPPLKAKVISGAGLGQMPAAPGSVIPDSNSQANSKSNAQPRPQPNLPSEKNLNVLFNWNGHTWDAYETLGCPAGGSAQLAQKAFDQAKKNMNAESLPFLEAALEAIRSAQAARRPN